MNKKIKVIIASMMLTVSLMGMAITVNAEGTSASNALQEALEQKTFYHYNMAYAEITKLQDVAERDKLLSQLTTITDIVWTDEVKQVNLMIDDMCKTASGKTYDQIEAFVNKSSLGAMDKGYLLGELTSWGRKLVWTSDYVNGVEQLKKVWATLDNTDSDTIIATAEKEIKKIQNANSRDYLLGELEGAKVEKANRPDYPTRIRQISSFDNLSVEEKNEKMNREITSLIYGTNLVKVPEAYKNEKDIMKLSKLFVRMGDRIKTIEIVQGYINGFVTDNEIYKLKAIYAKGTFIEIKANTGTEEIDVTDQLVVPETPLVDEIYVKLNWAGKHLSPKNIDGVFVDRHQDSEYLVVRNNRVYLKSKAVTTEYVKDCLNINVCAYNDTTGSETDIVIKIYQ